MGEITFIKGLTRRLVRCVAVGAVALSAGSAAAVVNAVTTTIEPAAAATRLDGGQNLTNSRIAAVAERYVGQRRPATNADGSTYNAPGQCIKWVQSWVKEAGGNMPGGGPISQYRNAGALEVSATDALRGDIVQISQGDTYNGSPHTFVLTSSRLSDNTFTLVEGNYDYNGTVRAHRRALSVPANHELHIWRFGNASGDPSVWGDHIVQWDGDTKAQKTSWLVRSDLKRVWIDSSATYNCLKSKNVPGPYALPAATLDRLADQNGVKASCTNPAPPPARAADRLTRDQWIGVNGQLVSSDGRYRLIVQGDGNLVAYNSANRPIWATNSVNSGANVLVMQSDGNVVLYASGGRPVWHTRTDRTAGDTFVMQSDGNIVLYGGGRALWASNTVGR